MDSSPNRIPVLKRGAYIPGPQLRGNLMDVAAMSPHSFGNLASPLACSSIFDSPKLCYDSTPSMLFYPSSSNVKSSHTSNAFWDALRSPTGESKHHYSITDFLSTQIGDTKSWNWSPTAHALTPTRPAASYHPTVPSPDEPEEGGEQLNLHSILDHQYPTLMLRHLPNKYTRDMLLEEFRDQELLDDIDFFYVPIDLRHQRNVGYCFVNLTSPDACRRFREAFDGAKLGRVETGKFCVVDVGKVQGLEANVAAYRNAAVMSMGERYQPLLLDKGEVVPFPPPTMTRAQMRSLKPSKKGVSKRDDADTNPDVPFDGRRRTRTHKDDSEPKFEVGKSFRARNSKWDHGASKYGNGFNRHYAY